MFQPCLSGLCGTFNDVSNDDMMTPQGVIEGSPLTFSNSWKANTPCSDREERCNSPCDQSLMTGKAFLLVEQVTI